MARFPRRLGSAGFPLGLGGAGGGAGFPLGLGGAGGGALSLGLGRPWGGVAKVPGDLGGRGDAVGKSSGFSVAQTVQTHHLELFQ